MPPYSTLKRGAREALGGNWGRAILILLIGAGVATLLSVVQAAATNLLSPPLPALSQDMDVSEELFAALMSVTWVDFAVLAAFTALGILLRSPLTLGVTYWYQSLYKRETARLPDIFRCFESGGRYLRAVWLAVNLEVRGILWSLLFFAVPAGVYIISLGAVVAAERDGMSADQLAIGSAGMLIGLALFLLAAVFSAAALNRYFLAAYLLCEDDGLTVRQAIKRSVACTRGYRFSILWFQLSFLLWFVLSGLLLLLPLLYAAPYFGAANAGLARHIIAGRGQRVSEASTQEFQV